MNSRRLRCFSLNHQRLYGDRLECSSDCGGRMSGMKTCFSLSSLQGTPPPGDESNSVKTESERPYNSLTRRPRKCTRDEHVRRSWGPNDENKDEFWAALQTNYNYLMDNQLIETCKEAHGELSWDDGDVAPGYVWSFQEFQEQYKELMSWLAAVQQDLCNKGGGLAEPTTMKNLIEELEKKAYRRKLFNEQAEKMLSQHPTLSEEINLNCSQLNGQWDALLHTLTPQRTTFNPTSIASLADLEREVLCLRRWLKDIESRLQPLDFSPGWTVTDLEEKIRENQRLQSEITGQGKPVWSVLRVCSELVEDHATSRQWDTDHVRRVASSLERRWHAAWLRALEWGCLLEQLQASNKCKEPGEKEKECASGGQDEPLNKYPRLNQPTELYFEDDVEGVYLSSEILGSGEDFADYPDSLMKSLSPEEELGSSPTPTNTSPEQLDKGVMVGTTGIAELKADCGVGVGEVLKFEIINPDVGYSSESSAHLSNDEKGDYEYKISKQVNSLMQQSTRVEEEEMIVESEGATALEEHSEDIKEGEMTEVVEEDKSEFNNSERKGPNCATFYFRHTESDSEAEWKGRRVQRTTLEQEMKRKEMLKAIRERTCTTTYKKTTSRMLEFGDVDEYKESMQRLYELNDDSDWVPGSILSDGELDSLDSHMAQSLLTELGFETSGVVEEEEEAQHFHEPCMGLQRCCSKESIHRLVNEAEDLVREEKPCDCTNRRKPPSLPLVRHASGTKVARVREWLKRINGKSDASSQAGRSKVIDSCDASGELTSEESEGESSTTDDKNGSVLLCPADTTITPTTETTLPKVIMRTGKRRRGRNDRPWSAHELQLSNFLALNRISLSEGNLQGMTPPSGLLQPMFGSLHLRGGIKPDMCSIGIQKNPGSPVEEDDKEFSLFRKVRHNKSKRRAKAKRAESSSEGGTNVFAPSSSSETQRSPKRKHSREPRPSGIVKSMSFSGSGMKSESHSSGTERCASEPVRMRRSTSTQEDGITSDTESDADPATIVEGVDSEEEAPVCRQPDELSSLSLSEQAWDPYQPYLSEGNSEEPLDQEAARRLLEFGDDYRNYIDSQSDATSSISHGPRSGTQSRASVGSRGTRKSTPPRSALPKIPVRGSVSPNSEWDSESELEELDYVMQDSYAQLALTQRTLAQLLASEAYSSPNAYAQLVATCQANLKALQDMSKHLSPGDGHQREEIKGMVSNWGMLQQQAANRHRQSTALRDVNMKMTALRDTLTDLQAKVQGASNTADIANRQELDGRLKTMKEWLGKLRDQKDVLQAVNMNLHAFVIETGVGGDNLKGLKGSVDDLYILWDQVYHGASSSLDSLQSLSDLWCQWENQFGELTRVLRKDEETLSLLRGALGESGSSNTRLKEALTEEQLSGCQWDARLTVLQQMVENIQTTLGEEAPATKALKKSLMGMRGQLKDLQKTCKELILQTIPPTQQYSIPSSDIVPITDKRERDRRWIWRVVRAALPFHLALLVLFCAACLLEPTCCGDINNLTSSWTPQLRYVNGPPPI